MPAPPTPLSLRPHASVRVAGRHTGHIAGLTHARVAVVHHMVTRAWLDTVDEPGVIHFCRATQQSFLRLLTNRTVLGAYDNGFELVTTDSDFTQYSGIALRLLTRS